MKQIRKIMCCCGNGVGTSLVMQMTMEDVLDDLGIEDVEVVFGLLSEASASNADLFVVSEEAMESVMGLPAIGLEDLMDLDEATEKLKQVLEIE